MVEIAVLGDFSIKVNNRIVSQCTGRAKKLWKLLSLLILSRNRPLTIQMIVASIWPDEDTDVSIKALHNLVFRLRRIFSEDGESQSYIIYSANGYMLNMEKDISIDIYTMEDYYTKAMASVSADEKIVCLEKAMLLYNGEYLMNTFDDLAAITAVNHYRHMFVDVITTLSDSYLDKGEYNKLFSICDKAITLEPLEEAIYTRLLKGLMVTGQTVRAISLCERYFDILYNEMGIRTSAQIYPLYAELKRNSINFPNPKSSSLTEFPEMSSANQAFFCDLGTFKEIYEYERRHIERRGTEKGIILLIGLKSKKHDLSSYGLLREAKNYLYKSCLNMLRKGDIFASHSDTHFIILLSDLKYGDYTEVIKRIRKNFYENYHYWEKEILIDFEIEPLGTEDSSLFSPGVAIHN